MALGLRGRRWLRILAVVVVLLALGAWWVDRQLEPHRLTTTVLARAGAALKLDLTYEGEPDYALRPEPRLVIPNLRVRDPRDGKLLLSAKRAEISLPWNTLTGGDPVITRVELQSPLLDLPALRRWQATRPPTPFELPTLTKGLAVVNGTVRDTSFTVSALALDLPHLKTGDVATATVAGKITTGDTVVDFHADVSAATPGLISSFSLDGGGALKQGDKLQSFKLSLQGDYRSDDQDALAINAPKFIFSGVSPLPELSGKANVALGKQLRFGFDGLIEHWPSDWPALPQPFAQDTSALPITLLYAGDTALNDVMSLTLHRGDTSLAANLRLPELQSWLAAADGSPLPPLNATLKTPVIEFDGIKLEGVEMEIHDDAPSVTAPVATPAKK